MANIIDKGNLPTSGNLREQLGFIQTFCLSRQDKHMDTEFVNQINFFKKVQHLYEPLKFVDSYYAKKVKEYIIGQDEGVDKLVYIVYHNLYQNMMRDYYGDDVKRISAIVIGPSGCGKTATLTRISQLFEIPFVKYNATQITSQGFVGKDAEEMLKQLVEAASGDIELAERGILYIDEIDKKVSSSPHNSSNRDINGTSVQEELLKFLEPSLIDLGHGQLFDTTYLTVLLSGRFVGIDDIKKKRLRGTNSIGFSDSQEGPVSSKEEFDEDLYNEFDDRFNENYIHQDIINFGFLDEFVGRTHVIVEFRKLSRNDLVDVIFAKESILQQFVTSLKIKGHELIIDQAIFERIADAAYNDPTGARSIESKVFKLLEPADRDSMKNYRHGIMEYDSDGNYSSVFESGDGELVYNSVESQRSKTIKKYS